MSKQYEQFDDSSDEEEIAIQNAEYNLVEHFKTMDSSGMKGKLQHLILMGSKKEKFLAKKGRSLNNFSDGMMQKSWLLHTIGKMIIFSPEVEKIYRPYKRRLLQPAEADINEERKSAKRQRTTLPRNEENKLDTDELGVKVNNTMDLLTVGRLFARNIKREFRNAKDIKERKDQQLETKIHFSSNNKSSSSVVQETLAFNSKGFSNSSFPFMDRVQLHLPDDAGDYPSAYKSNKPTQGLQATSQTVKAANSLAEYKDDTELKEAADVIDSLKKEIAEHFPNISGDAYIADCIRKTLKGEVLLGLNQGMQDRLYSLSYLLFKTEVYRSPAALINHVQMLELIINGQMSLEDAFQGKNMPMSIRGAIKAGRYLDELYNALDGDKGFYKFSNPYDYSKDNNEMDNLVILESSLMDDWLAIKFPVRDAGAINVEFLPEICKEIYGSLQSFGINVHSKALFNTMTYQFPENTETKERPVVSSSSSFLERIQEAADEQELNSSPARK